MELVGKTASVMSANLSGWPSLSLTLEDVIFHWLWLSHYRPFSPFQLTPDMASWMPSIASSQLTFMQKVSWHKFVTKINKMEFIPGVLLHVLLDEIIAPRGGEEDPQTWFSTLFFTWMQDFRCKAPGQRESIISPGNWERLDWKKLED